MIYELLAKGRDNARTSKELCKVLNITPRELTRAVQQERRAGQPICAATGTKKGYYLAESKEEMQRFCTALLHRAGEIHKTRRACIKTIEHLPL